jgi:hypothetical protein
MPILLRNISCFLLFAESFLLDDPGPPLQDSVQTDQSARDDDSEEDGISLQHPSFYPSFFLLNHKLNIFVWI